MLLLRLYATYCQLFMYTREREVLVCLSRRSFWERINSMPTRRSVQRHTRPRPARRRSKNRTRLFLFFLLIVVLILIVLLYVPPVFYLVPLLVVFLFIIAFFLWRFWPREQLIQSRWRPME